MATGLAAIGARVLESEDGLIIDGTGGDPLAGGATIAGHLDHRICMSFAIAGLVSKAPVEIDDMAPVGTSFPNFEALLERSEEHTSELQSLMRISYAVFCLKKKKKTPLYESQKTTNYK